MTWKLTVPFISLAIAIAANGCSTPSVSAYPHCLVKGTDLKVGKGSRLGDVIWVRGSGTTDKRAEWVLWVELEIDGARYFNDGKLTQTAIFPIWRDLSHFGDGKKKNCLELSSNVAPANWGGIRKGGGGQKPLDVSGHCFQFETKRPDLLQITLASQWYPEGSKTKTKRLWTVPSQIGVDQTWALAPNVKARITYFQPASYLKARAELTRKRMNEHL